LPFLSSRFSFLVTHSAWISHEAPPMALGAPPAGEHAVALPLLHPSVSVRGRPLPCSTHHRRATRPTQPAPLALASTRVRCSPAPPIQPASTRPGPSLLSACAASRWSSAGVELPAPNARPCGGGAPLQLGAWACERPPQRRARGVHCRVPYGRGRESSRDGCRELQVMLR
jgi:hypothetical protein